MKKHWSFSWKPPVGKIVGKIRSARSFQGSKGSKGRQDRSTEHWEGNKSPAVQRGSAVRRHEEGAYIRLHLILNCINKYTVTDRRRAMSLSNTPALKNGHHRLHIQFVSVEYQRTPHCRTVLQNVRKKTKASPEKQLIMVYLPGFLQDPKPLSSCFGNRSKMLLKCHLGIKCHSKYINVLKLL